MANDRTLLSYRYERPDNGVKKPVSVIFRLYSDVIHGTGGRELARTTENDSDYYIIARAYIAFLGTVLIVVAWWIGRQFSYWTGVTAAICTAVFPIFVKYSHYVASDISVTLAMGLCMLSAISYMNAPNRVRVFPMVFFAALGTLDKYPGILTCGMIALVVIWMNRNNIRELFIQGVIAFSAYVLLMLCISPNLFINWKDVYDRIVIENRNTHLGADGLSWLGNMAYYADTFVKSMGISPSIFWIGFCAGIVSAFAKRERKALVFSAPAFWWVLLSSRALHWERWGMPMYFGWIILIAYGIGMGIEWVARTVKCTWIRNSIAFACCTGAMLYIFINPLTSIIDNTANLLSKKTYIQSAELLDMYDINDVNCTYDARTPLFIRTSPEVNWTQKTVMHEGRLYRTDSRILYILQNDSQKGRYAEEPDVYAEVLEEYEWLSGNMEPIKVYKPHARHVRSKNIPVLTIWRKLAAVLTDNYIAGSRVALFDVKSLPLLQYVRGTEFKKTNAAEVSSWLFELGTVMPGDYEIEITGRTEQIEAVYLDGQKAEPKKGNIFSTHVDEEKTGIEILIQLSGNENLECESVLIRQMSM